MSDVTIGCKHPPANPYYRFEWVIPMSGGNAMLSIPAPGGCVSAKDVKIAEAWAELVLHTMRQCVEPESTQPAAPAAGQEETE